MPYGIVQADQLQTSVTGATLGPGNATGFKNRIINGGMVLDQRNAGASVTIPNTGSQYVLDRWYVNASQASKFSVQQTPSATETGYATRVAAGFTNYLGITSASSYSLAAGDFFQLIQSVEGLNVSDLAWGTANAKTVTLSFLVYSSLTGTFGGVINNSAVNRVYPFSYTISSANTWTQISVTISGDTTGTWLTTNGIGLQLRLSLGMGSNYTGGTAGAWTTSLTYPNSTSIVSTSGATFYITGVQLEVGSNATGFQFRDYGRELILCQRYFEKAGWTTSQAPGSTSGYTGDCVLLRIPGLANSFGGSMAYQVLKRAAPTITLYGSIGGATETSGIVVDFYTGNSLGASTASRIGDRQFTDISTTSDSTYGTLFRFTAAAEL